MVNILKGKAYCMKCSKAMKFKKERSTSKLICSSYDNKGECERIIIEHDFIISTIERRYDKEITRADILELVEKIEVRNKYEFCINFYNDKPIFALDGHFQF